MSQEGPLKLGFLIAEWPVDYQEPWVVKQRPGEKPGEKEEMSVIDGVSNGVEEG